jgi:hypothetical protein
MADTVVDVAAVSARAEPRSAWRTGVFVVVLTATMGLALTLQGWKSRIPLFDLVTYVHSARDFLAHGSLPRHGDTGSYGNFKPPGTAWLMVPSTILFSDPRLSEYVGTGLLYAAGLAGVFLLARMYFGLWCACFSVVLYGLSQHGLFFAGSLWPNGRPEFFVWIIYFASLWVSRGEPGYLAIGATLWAMAMHIDMAIAPAFFVFPALWLLYRPPLRASPMVIGAIVALIVWYPYLRFETSRDFADVKSMLLLRDIRPANHTESWCNPGLTLSSWERASAPGLMSISAPANSPRNAVAEVINSRIIVPASKLSANFHAGYLADRAIFGPATALMLLLLTLISMLLLTRSQMYRSGADVSGGARWMGRLGMFAIAAGLILNEWIIARYVSVDGTIEPSTAAHIRWLQVAMIVSGAVSLLLRKPLAHLLRRLLDAGKVRRNVNPLAVSLLVPWIILLIVAEPGKPERFWWLWPLQIVFLAALVTNVLSRVRRAWPITSFVFGFIALALLCNPLALSRVNSWIEKGWSGAEAAEIEAVDFIADQLRAEGKNYGPIGYQVYIYPFMAEYNIANPQYKVGADFDLLLKYRHGITNTNTCAEGISSQDEYRIVQSEPRQEAWRPRDYFDVPHEPSFRLVRQFDLYQIFKHTHGAPAGGASSGVSA